MKLFLLALVVGLTACSTPGAPAVTVQTTPIDATVIIDGHPATVHCSGVPVSCIATYTFDGQTITVVYPVPTPAP